MKHLFLLCAFACLFVSVGFSQSKTHYRILDSGIDISLPAVESQLSDLDLDPYRYVHVRRQLTIQGTNYVIELYSADELWQMYQKILSPNNKEPHTDPYPQAHFEMAPSGRIKLMPN